MPAARIAAGRQTGAPRPHGVAQPVEQACQPGACAAPRHGRNRRGCASPAPPAPARSARFPGHARSTSLLVPCSPFPLLLFPQMSKLGPQRPAVPRASKDSNASTLIPRISAASILPHSWVWQSRIAALCRSGRAARAASISPAKAAFSRTKIRRRAGSAISAASSRLAPGRLRRPVVAFVHRDPVKARSRTWPCPAASARRGSTASGRRPGPHPRPRPWLPIMRRASVCILGRWRAISACAAARVTLARPLYEVGIRIDHLSRFSNHGARAARNRPRAGLSQIYAGAGVFRRPF